MPFLVLEGILNNGVWKFKENQRALMGQKNQLSDDINRRQCLILFVMIIEVLFEQDPSTVTQQSLKREKTWFVRSFFFLFLKIKQYVFEP